MGFNSAFKGLMALTAKQANLNFHVIISVWHFDSVLSIIIRKNFMLVILDFILLILLF
jgi:hypothetical protein